MASRKTQYDALLDELLKDYTTPQEILGAHGLLKQLTKRLVERALEAELTAHLGYAPHARQAGARGNYRNGTGTKTVHLETGRVTLRSPVTGTPASSLSWSKSASGAWRGSTTKCWPCIPGDCPRGTSRGIWRNSMELRCRRR